MTECVPVEGCPVFRCIGWDVDIHQDEGTAWVYAPEILVVCHGLLASRFGYPNDEALPGDPLYESGLEYGGCVEIRNSPWLEEINRRNKIPFPDFKGFDSRHYYLVFHDSSFEVLCDRIEFIGPWNFWGQLVHNFRRRTRRRSQA